MQVEHAFGILNGRWQILRSANLRCKTKSDEARAQGIIQAAFILHNLCVLSWKDIFYEDELKIVLGEEQMERKRTLNEDQRTGEARMASHRRRDRLVDQLLEPDDDVVEETIA